MAVRQQGPRHDRRPYRNSCAGCSHRDHCPGCAHAHGVRAVKRKPAQWLADKVESSSRYAKAAQCPRCGADVFIGPDAWRPPDRIATVDPSPVNELTEAIAYLGGRLSYALIVSSAGQRLEYRTVNYRPSRYPIVLDHRCGP